MNQELLEKCKNADLLKEVAKGKEVVWINENLEKTEDAMAKINITMADIDDAEARLARFAPFLMKKFPETIPTNGLIESPLTYIPNMQKKLEEHYDTKIPGKMFLKQDSHLAISGSVKARGGIYEVLKHAEDFWNMVCSRRMMTIAYSLLMNSKNFSANSKFRLAPQAIWVCLSES